MSGPFSGLNSTSVLLPAVSLSLALALGTLPTLDVPTLTLQGGMPLLL
jgi:hypothetical protein